MYVKTDTVAGSMREIRFITVCADEGSCGFIDLSGAAAGPYKRDRCLLCLKHDPVYFFKLGRHFSEEHSSGHIRQIAFVGKSKIHHDAVSRAQSAAIGEMVRIYRIDSVGYDGASACFPLTEGSMIVKQFFGKFFFAQVPGDFTYEIAHALIVYA